MLFSWLTEWKRLGRIVSRKNRSSHRKRLLAVVSGQVEILEERTLLTDFVVTTLIDEAYDADGNDGTDGTGLSLREAIGLANDNTTVDTAVGSAGMLDGDTISFAPGLAGMTTQITLGILTVTDDLAVNGDAGVSGTRIVIDGIGNNNERIFTMDAAIKGTIHLITLQNLIVQNARQIRGGGNGGGILSDGDLTLDNVQLAGNSAENDGGGIYHTAGTLTVQGGSLIVGNAAKLSLLNRGGGIYTSNASVSITGSTIRNNTAGNGGGLSNDGGTVTINGGSIFQENFAARGGGIESQSFGMLTISASTIDANTATTAAGIMNVRSTALIDDGTSITNNLATDNQIAVGANSAGGILNAGTLTVRNSTIRGNTGDRGGGVYNVGTAFLEGGTLISENVANGTLSFHGGGGIGNENRITIDNSTIENNSATNKGGGILNDIPDANTTNRLATATIQGGTLITGNSTMGDGGGIFNGFEHSFEFADSMLIDNTASGAGGGIYNENELILFGTTTTLDTNNPDTISGIASGSVTVNAPSGRVTFAFGTVSTYTGATSVESGTLVVDGTIDDNGTLDSSAGDVFIQNSATLSGSGIVDAPVIVQNMGTISPGSSDTAILTTGHLEFDDASGNPIFEIQVNGVTTAGTDYDQLCVTGSVNIDPGTTLSTSGTVAGTEIGDVVTLIDNDGSDQVIGHFQGLMEGATVTIDGEEFQISYSGGDGNDVVLAATRTPPPPIVFVNDDFAVLAPGAMIEDADPNTAGDQSAIFGVTAFATIQVGIDAVELGGTVFITDDVLGDTDPLTGNETTANDGPGNYNERILIGKDLSIVGTDGNPLAVEIDGDGPTGMTPLSGSLVAVLPGTTVTIDGVSIQDGSSNIGGGIINQAKELSIRNSIIRNNEATESGGGIYNANLSQLSIADTLIQGNSAASDGGGIFSDSGSVSVTGGLISMNTAMENGGGLAAVSFEFDISGGEVSNNYAGISGGGIYSTSRATIDDTMIRGNTSDGDGASFGGGGFFNLGFATILGSSQIAGNTAHRGGGVFTRLQLTISGSSEIMGNTATFGGGGLFIVSMAAIQDGVRIAENFASNGGGIFTGGGLTLDNAIVEMNTAVNGGGGIAIRNGTVTIPGGTLITGNSATSGGGIENRGGTVMVSGGSVISGNSASGFGGGIANFFGFTPATTLTLDNATVEQNTANSGGGIYNIQGVTTIQGGTVISGNSVSADGGGIYNNQGETTIQGGTLITGNSAVLEGGGVSNDAGTMMIQGGTTITGNSTLSFGGGISNSGSNAILTVESTTVAMNSASSGGGLYNDAGTATIVGTVQITENSASRGGGGIYNIGSSAMLTVDNATVGSNTTPANGGGIYNGLGTMTIQAEARIVENIARGNGGGVFNFGGEVEINNVTIGDNLSETNFIFVGGGGVYNAGEMKIIDSTIQGNSAHDGGGILNTEGSLTVIGGTVDGNTAARAGGGIENNSGDATIVNVTVSGNTADINGGGVHQSGDATITVAGGLFQDNTASQEGGGLWNPGDGTMTVDSTVILQNTAKGNDAEQGGGGVFNDTGGTVTILNAVITQNEALGDDPSEGGGGIFNEGRMTITDTSITNNEVLNGLGSGGGILNSSDGVLTVAGIGSQITGNQAARAGGGIENNGGTINLTDVSVNNNTAGINGGGLHQSSVATATITGGTVSDNTASRQGGGLWNSDTGMMTINGTTIDSNTASGDDENDGGGGILNRGTLVIGDMATVSITNNIVNGISASGGGIQNRFGGTMTVIGTIIESNAAIGAFGSGGGIFNSAMVTIQDGSQIIGNTASTDGGGIANFSNLAVDDSRISGNTASNSGGGIWNRGATMVQGGSQITGNSASSSGGGLVNSGGTVTVQGGSQITSNSSTFGGGITNAGTLMVDAATISSNTASTRGGGIWSSGTATIQGGTMITGNSASEEGGGLMNFLGSLTIDGVTIDGNTASGVSAAQGGGGVYNVQGTLTVLGSTISNNIADGTSGSGGGFNNGGILVVTQSTITGNSAANEGGGIYNELFATATIQEGTNIAANMAIDGAGIYSRLHASLTINASSLIANSSSRNGGAIYNEGALLIEYGSTISQNSAASEGGGIENAHDHLIVRGSTISMNTAVVGDGGGIQNYGTVTIEGGSVLSGNSARSGGGIANYSGHLTVSASIIENNLAESGGGIISVDDSVTSLESNSLIANNTATVTAGGISNEGMLTVSNSTIWANSANGEFGTGFRPELFGGGIVNIGTALITNSEIIENAAKLAGGGLWNHSSGMMTIDNTLIQGNSVIADSLNVRGGGLFNDGGTVNIIQSSITNNTASSTSGDGDGGGIYNGGGTLIASDSTLSANTASNGGGGIWNSGTLELTQITISGNDAVTDGGGIYTERGRVDINNTTIAFNDAGMGGGIFHDGSGTVTITSTIVGANSESNITGTVKGAFNLISGDPRLGPLADNGGPTQTHALLQDSPAINAGDNPLGLMFDQRGTPFVREFGSGIDPQQTDIGAYELQNAAGGGNDIIVTANGPGTEGQVQVVNAITQEVIYNITPYPSFTGGVRVAVGDVNGDQTPDIITAAGPGGGPHVKVFDGADGTTELLSFFAYGSAFTGGLFVAAADLDEDGNADIITGADAGGGPHVRAFSGEDASELFNFFAYNPAFPGGVRVGAGDINGDGIPDIITGAGPGGGPHVRVFDGSVPQRDGREGTDIGGPLGSFFPYNPAFTGGVYLAAGDVDGDNQIDLITGAGEGGGPHVRVFSGATGEQLPGDIGSFLAYDSGFNVGVRVAAVDITGDGKADVITTPGEGGGPNVRAFDADSQGPEEIRNRLVGDASFTGGIFVAASTKLESTTQTLELADGFAPMPDSGSLSRTDANFIFDAALSRLESLGLPSDVGNTLAPVSIEIADLSGNRLGESRPGSIRLDVDAAGAGWFVDPTPQVDEEFASNSLIATDASALGRVDLLTVVLHELFHRLGADDSNETMRLMADTLPPSQRHIPREEDLDQLFSDGQLLASLLED